MTATLGILGGGQLAQMLCQAAEKLDIETYVLCPDPEAPARRFCTHFILADYLDIEAVRRFGEHCDVVTLDSEHIPYDSQVLLSDLTTLQPSLNTMLRIRDRLAQRGLLMQLAAPQVRFWSIDKAVSVKAAQLSARFPAVLKSRQGGYDGYGQVYVATQDALEDAWQKLGRCPCVLESWVENAQEFSIVGARDAEGSVRLYPAISNDHQDGQLQRSTCPADVPKEAVAEARAIWCKIASTLHYEGVMAVEFFLSNGNVLVNEIAPRVHNSGHVTQMTCKHSQFDMHVRAIMGLPLPHLEIHKTGMMLNIYPQHGINDPAMAEKLESQIGGKIILYGKKAKPRRKLGHWLLPQESAAQALQLLNNSE